MAKPPPRDQARSANKNVVKVVRKAKVLVGSSGGAGLQPVVDASTVTKAGSVFFVGDHVTHDVFGSGKVLMVNDNKLEIRFQTVGEKWIVDSFVKHSR